MDTDRDSAVANGGISRRKCCRSHSEHGNRGNSGEGCLPGLLLQRRRKQQARWDHSAMLSKPVKPTFPVLPPPVVLGNLI